MKSHNISRDLISVLRIYIFKSLIAKENLEQMCLAMYIANIVSAYGTTASAGTMIAVKHLI